MAGRGITVTGNADMSSFASTSGSDPGVDTILIVFDDADSKLARAAALTRAIEKLAEEGWI